MTTTGNEHDRTRAGGGGGGKPEACSRNEARNEAGNADGDDDEDEDEDEDEDDEVDVQSAALGFKIQLRGEGAVDGTVVVVRWLKGSDAVLFESFCGMIKRKSGDVR